MNFVQAVKSCFQNYFNFKTRAPRSEYWYFILFYVIVSVPAQVVDSLFFPEIRASYEIGPFDAIVTLGLLVPSISVTARRLHDIGKSGWWQLIVLTIIGIIPLIYWMVKKGDEGKNRFGDNPLSYTQV